MTQSNIDVMGIIVDKMAEGEKFSKALASIYANRNIRIPYKEEYCTEPIEHIGMPRRAANALLRAKLRTLGDVIEFCEGKKITDITGVGTGLGIDMFESILDYCWSHMSQDEQTNFLIDTVERNGDYIRENLEL